MKITKVLEKVDKWQPNIFDTEDKLQWCYEVTMDILTECPKYRSYAVKVTYDGSVLMLPEGVSFSQIARVYKNGILQEIRDERTLEDAVFKKGDTVYIVYRQYPEAYAPREGDEVPEELETVCGAPFDAMYIDYVCAQIAFQQNDLGDYDKFISSYNVRFEAYKRFYGSNSPVSDRKNFVHLY